MNEIEAVQMFSALQLERKQLQQEFETLAPGEQKSQARAFQLRKDFVETGLKICVASKGDKLEDEIMKLKERLKLLEHPHLQRVK